MSHPGPPSDSGPRGPYSRPSAPYSQYELAIWSHAYTETFKYVYSSKRGYAETESLCIQEADNALATFRTALLVLVES